MISRSRQHGCKGREVGFTLVELMIVLVILGLTASLVVLTMSDGGGDLEQDAQRFAARTAALRDNAILQSRPMAVQVTSSGYSFLERRKGSWSVLEDKPFVSTNWSTGVAPSLENRGSMLISFESTGLPSDQSEILLRRNDQQRSIIIAPMGDVRLGDNLKSRELQTSDSQGGTP
ncbi:type II secretion system minor pseudopilin GspH [Parasphingorhabdus sp.]|uniref:type II secretion system minor pseudopilin GspH n=1 Tax=Parasphingorhabdus sp. TaxID=2709688 RepID=UPI0032658AED